MALKAHGSSLIWMHKHMYRHGIANGKRGHILKYSEAAVYFCLTIEGLFNLPFLMMPLLWHILAGCQPSGGGSAATVPGYEPQVISVSLTGYNYTDREISDFSVGGRGGGNVAVGTPTSGGGGTVCCVPYVVSSDPGSVRVRWQSGACYYHTKSTISDEVHEHIHWFFREKDVEVDKPAARDPQYLEVHFYPDGAVKVAVTEHAGAPRLKLPETRRNRVPYPRCPDDKKPAA